MEEADGGGSNGYRSRLWKLCLQKIANYLKIPIKVCHFPPEQANGIKLNIVYSLSFLQIGEENHLRIMKQWYLLLAQQQLQSVWK
jgi:hypothetical protein